MFVQRNVYISKELILTLNPMELAYVLTYAPFGNHIFHRGYFEQMRDTGLSDGSSRRVRKSLMEKGYLQMITRHSWRLNLPRPRGAVFTMVPAAAIVRLKDAPRLLKLYAYLLCKCGRLRCAYQSYRKMEKELGVAASSLYKKDIPALVERGLIDVHRRHYKDTRAYRSHCYYVRTTEEAIEGRLKALKIARAFKKKAGRKAARVILRPSALIEDTPSPGHGTGIFRPPR